MTPQRETCSGAAFCPNYTSAANWEHLTAKQRGSRVTHDDTHSTPQTAAVPGARERERAANPTAPLAITALFPTRKCAREIKRKEQSVSLFCLVLFRALPALSCGFDSYLRPARFR
ncbi:hypothetical protein NL108_008824 [Boleophthalmus pectinirostris]|nr:hypothetical protein NL108_008824 [Boleophthalmus pectinirostris]